MLQLHPITLLNSLTAYICLYSSFCVWGFLMSSTIRDWTRASNAISKWQ